ncbi:MAG: hypothetical protein LBU79_04755 [Planctomycetota bacterium]|jgi:hypothetical protein|nr:hypothetical protein [Planctomycetota bacterium]
MSWNQPTLFAAMLFRLSVPALLALGVGVACSAEGGLADPPLLFERPLPPPVPKAVGKWGQKSAPAEKTAPAEKIEKTEKTQTGTGKGKYAPFRDHRRKTNELAREKEEITQVITEGPVAGVTDEEVLTEREVAESDESITPEEALPTPEGVENYRARLEVRLLERYNNLPASAGKVGQVRVVLSRPIEVSLDGRFLRAEFDQLVYDIWGRRLPALEKEYYIVTFGSGGSETVRSDPSIRVGLDLEKTYSEHAPLAADPFRNVKDLEDFRREASKEVGEVVKMPDWWRPEYPEIH